MSSRLIHPRMLEALRRDFFNANGSIQQATKTRSTSGQEKKEWSNVAGWENIPCRRAGMGGGERRYASQTFLDATDVIVLAGVFNGITEKMRFVIGTEIFDILRPEVDSEKITTRLTVRTAR